MSDLKHRSTHARTYIDWQILTDEISRTNESRSGSFSPSRSRFLPCLIWSFYPPSVRHVKIIIEPPFDRSNERTNKRCEEEEKMCPNECTNVILSSLDRRSQMHLFHFISFHFVQRERGSSVIPIILSPASRPNAESSSSINVKERARERSNLSELKTKNGRLPLFSFALKEQKSFLYSGTISSYYR